MSFTSRWVRACSMAKGSSNFGSLAAIKRESNYIDILPDVLRRRPRASWVRIKTHLVFKGGVQFWVSFAFAAHNWHLGWKATGHCACWLTKANLLFALCIRSDRCLTRQAFQWYTAGMLMWTCVLWTVDRVIVGDSYHYLWSSLY